MLAIPPVGAEDPPPVLPPPPLPVESRSESFPGVFFSLALAIADAKFDMAGGCDEEEDWTVDAGDRPAVPVIGLLIQFPEGNGGGLGVPNRAPGGGGGGGGGGADDIGGA